MVRSRRWAALTLVLLFLCAQGCATWQKNTATTFEVAGVTLSELHNTAKQLRALGKLSDDQTKQFNDLYKKAVTLYKTCGQTAILAIETEDSVKRQAYMTELGELRTQLSTVIISLTALIEEVKK